MLIWRQQMAGYLLTVDGGWRNTLIPGTSLELFLNRDWVETRRALDQGVRFTFAGASLEQAFGPHVTAIGIAARQEFSDGNSRNHGRLRLIYQPNLDLGLTLQLRYRSYRSERNDPGVTYCNPEKYEERLFALGWRRRFHSWAGNLVVGSGQQRIAGAPLVPSYLLEFSLQSPPARRDSIRMRGGFNQSASFNGPNYPYRLCSLNGWSVFNGLISDVPEGILCAIWYSYLCESAPNPRSTGYWRSVRRRRHRRTARLAAAWRAGWPHLAATFPGGAIWPPSPIPSAACHQP